MQNRIEIRPQRIINVTIHRADNPYATAFLIHGLGGRGAQWREQINILKNKYTLIIPDLLGCGDSTKPKPDASNPYLFTELKADLDALFNKYSTAQNIMFGHSYGGALASAITLDHQDKINKLVLISPTSLEPKLKIPFMYSLPVFLMVMFRTRLEKKFQQLAFSANTDKALLIEESQSGRKNNLMYVIKASVNGMKAIPKTNISTLSVPSLIILGREDGIIPITISQNFYRALPHHQFSIIENAAHLVMLEKPDQVNQLILNFLMGKNAVPIT